MILLALSLQSQLGQNEGLPLSSHEFGPHRPSGAGGTVVPPLKGAPRLGRIFQDFESVERLTPSEAKPLERICRWQILVNNVPNRRWRLTRKAFLGGLCPPDPPKWSAAVAASASQEGPSVIALVGRCRGLRRPVFGVMSKISMSSQDDFGQVPACSALAMETKQVGVKGLRPLASNG